MGGKNKKHKAPGAAAVRAAVSASRAKSAEAGVAGEAQNQKPVARPSLAAAAASTRESRVKQGTSGRRAACFLLLLVSREKATGPGQTLGVKICLSRTRSCSRPSFQVGLSCLGLQSSDSSPVAA